MFLQHIADLELSMYKKMVRIRKFEEKAAEIHYKGLLPGFGTIHSYIGEEAVAVGVTENLKDADYITSTHRPHGHMIAKGGDMRYIMAELFGKSTGCCNGRVGSMHLADLDLGILGANGIVGGGMPIAVGAGLSAKLRGTDQVVVCFFGDGALCQGSFHESLNLASLWKLPVIFVCENNQYFEFTPIKNSVSSPDTSAEERAATYGMPGISIDGMDVLAVYQATHDVVKKTREGSGPAFVECKTYRFRDHFEGASDVLGRLSYRSEHEVDEWLRLDPIENLRTILLGKQTFEGEIAKIEADAAKEVDEAVRFAIESPTPEPEETLMDFGQ